VKQTDWARQQLAISQRHPHETFQGDSRLLAKLTLALARSVEGGRLYLTPHPPPPCQTNRLTRSTAHCIKPGNTSHTTLQGWSSVLARLAERAWGCESTPSSPPFQPHKPPWSTIQRTVKGPPRGVGVSLPLCMTMHYQALAMLPRSACVLARLVGKARPVETLPPSTTLSRTQTTPVNSPLLKPTKDTCLQLPPLLS
jgi:hypothetical protein